MMRTADFVKDIERTLTAELISGATWWRAMMAHSDIPLCVYELDAQNELRIVEANSAAEPYGLVSAKAAAGMLVRDAIIPEIAEYVTPRVLQCIRSGEPQGYERAVDLPSGRQQWATNLIPVRDGGSEIRQVIGLLRPLPPEFHDGPTEIRNRRLMDALMSSDLGLIYIYDGTGRRVTFASGKVSSLLGITSTDLEQMEDPVLALVHPDDLGAVELELDLIDERSRDHEITFECRLKHADGSYRRLCFHSKVLERDQAGRWKTLIGVARDITDQARLHEEIAFLNQQLASAQLMERRLVAQELHDSAGQYLIAAKLAMANLKVGSPELLANDKARNAVEDVVQCLDDADREIRVLSYVLHPPAVANQNLATVLRNFAVGFGGRSGIAVNVSIDRKVNAAQEQLSMPLLRICQEALSNVHRHSKAKSVSVTVDVIGDNVDLEIRDDGVGFESQEGEVMRRTGLGLTSMRERVEALGGTLVIRGDQGTSVRATFPLR